MPIRAIARLIQTMLYARRFFPYYVYNILGGIEEDGKFARMSCDTDGHILAYFVNSRHMCLLSAMLPLRT